MRRNSLKTTRRFERLEDRRMMAADIDLENGIVEVTGTDNRDLIVIEADPNDADEILVTIKNAAGQILEQEGYDRDDVASIRVFAGGGNDDVTNNTNIQSELNGEGGIDTLIGGSARDRIFGGTEADNLEGRGGNDDLTGGAGGDRYRFFGSLLGTDAVFEAANVDVDTLDFSGLLGGINVNLASTATQVVNSTHLSLRLSSVAGLENVVGTAFEDTIRGNARNNELRGEGLNDHIFGGNGADTLLGGFGDDDLHGEGGLDRLEGGADRDLLDGGFDLLADVMIGNGGADTFVLHRRASGGPADQSVRDFNNAIDFVITQTH